MQTQANAKRTSISKTLIEIDGHIKTLSKWCEVYNIPYARAAMRLRRGKTGAELFEGGPDPLRSDGKQSGYQFGRGHNTDPNGRSNLATTNRHAERIRALAKEKDMAAQDVLDTILDNFFKKWDTND